MRTTLAVFFLALSVPLFAQVSAVDLKKEVRIEQLLGAHVPPDIKLTNEVGELVTIGQFYNSKPVALALVYYTCPRLCNMVLNGLVSAMKQVKQDAGVEFEIVCVSIDPNDTPKIATAKKNNYTRVYDRPGTEKGWHFLTGQDVEIKRLADAVGYRYKYDKSTGRYAHAAGFMILSPQGTVTQYFLGTEYPIKDIEKSIDKAAREQVGEKVDQVDFWCFVYDPRTGKYSMNILRTIQVFAILTILGLGTLIFKLVKGGQSASATMISQFEDIDDKGVKPE